MNKLKSAITKPWWKPYSFIRGNKVVQTRDQTITHLLCFYLFSISLAFLSAVIQIWGIPAKWGSSEALKDSLGPLAAAILVKLSYDFIRDVIGTEFDAGTGKIQEEVREEYRQKIQDLEVELQNSNKHLHKTYLSYLQKHGEWDQVKLQGVDRELQRQYSENRAGFGENLKTGFENSKDKRKIRCIIHDLDDSFLQQLAVQGIIDGLGLKVRDVLERTKTGNDLHSLRVDIYAYLSAWLICSIDNDLGVLMPIQPIGMRYKESNVPQKETYTNIIRAIKQVIISNKYSNLSFYPESDPLASDLVKNTIVSYLDEFIDLVDK